MCSNIIKEIPSWLKKTYYWDFCPDSMEPNKDGCGCIFPLSGSCSIYTAWSTLQAVQECIVESRMHHLAPIDLVI